MVHGGGHRTRGKERAKAGAGGQRGAWHVGVGRFTLGRRVMMRADVGWVVWVLGELNNGTEKH